MYSGKFITPAILSAFLIIFSSLAYPYSTPDPSKTFYADANGDQLLQSDDIPLHKLQVCLGHPAYNTPQLNNADDRWNTCDVTGDFKCMSNDLSSIKQVVYGTPLAKNWDSWEIVDVSFPATALIGAPYAFRIAPRALEVTTLIPNARPGIVVKLTVAPDSPVQNVTLGGRVCPVVDPKCAVSVGITQWQMSTTLAPTETGAEGFSFTANEVGVLILIAEFAAQPSMKIAAASVRFTSNIQQEPPIGTCTVTGNRTILETSAFILTVETQPERKVKITIKDKSKNENIVTDNYNGILWAIESDKNFTQIELGEKPGWMFDAPTFLCDSFDGGICSPIKDRWDVNYLTNLDSSAELIGIGCESGSGPIEIKHVVNDNDKVNFEVTVSLLAGPDANTFDAKVNMKNLDSELFYGRIIFPFFQFDSSILDQTAPETSRGVYTSWFGGFQFDEDFFTADHYSWRNYPEGFSFADFLFLNSTEGSLGMFTLKDFDTAYQSQNGEITWYSDTFGSGLESPGGIALINNEHESYFLHYYLFYLKPNGSGAIPENIPFDETTFASLRFQIGVPEVYSDLHPGENPVIYSLKSYRKDRGIDDTASYDLRFGDKSYKSKTMAEYFIGFDPYPRWNSTIVGPDSFNRVNSWIGGNEQSIYPKPYDKTRFWPMHYQGGFLGNSPDNNPSSSLTDLFGSGFPDYTECGLDDGFNDDIRDNYDYEGLPGNVGTENEFLNMIQTLHNNGHSVALPTIPLVWDVNWRADWDYWAYPDKIIPDCSIDGERDKTDIYPGHWPGLGRSLREGASLTSALFLDRIDNWALHSDINSPAAPRKGWWGYLVNPFSPLARMAFQNLAYKAAGEYGIESIYMDLLMTFPSFPVMDPETGGPSAPFVNFPFSYWWGKANSVEAMADAGLLVAGENFSDFYIKNIHYFNGNTLNLWPASNVNEYPAIIRGGHPYPVSEYLAHDKIGYTPGFIGQEISSELVISFSMTFGYSFKQELTNIPHVLDMFRFASLLQKELGPHYVGLPITEFEWLELGVDAFGLAVSRFGEEGQVIPTTGMETLGNFNGISKSVGENEGVFNTFTLAPNGFISISPTLGARDNPNYYPQIIAGIFEDTFNGEPLSGVSPHYIMVSKKDNDITVYKISPKDLSKTNSPMDIELPADWNTSEISAYAAFDGASEAAANVDFEIIDNAKIRIDYAPVLAGQNVDHYVIASRGVVETATEYLYCSYDNTLICSIDNNPINPSHSPDPANFLYEDGVSETAISLNEHVDYLVSNDPLDRFFMDIWVRVDDETIITEPTVILWNGQLDIYGQPIEENSIALTLDKYDENPDLDGAVLSLNITDADSIPYTVLAAPVFYPGAWHRITVAIKEEAPGYLALLIDGRLEGLQDNSGPALNQYSDKFIVGGPSGLPNFISFDEIRKFEPGLPLFGIDEPKNGAMLTGDSAEISYWILAPRVIQASEGDIIDLLVDGEIADSQAVDTSLTNTGEFYLDTTDFPNGYHELSLQYSSDNVVKSTSLDVSVEILNDHEAPVLMVIHPTSPVPYDTEYQIIAGYCYDKISGVEKENIKVNGAEVDSFDTSTGLFRHKLFLMSNHADTPVSATAVDNTGNQVEKLFTIEQIDMPEDSTMPTLEFPDDYYPAIYTKNDSLTIGGKYSDRGIEGSYSSGVSAIDVYIKQENAQESVTIHGTFSDPMEGAFHIIVPIDGNFVDVVGAQVCDRAGNCFDLSCNNGKCFTIYRDLMSSPPTITLMEPSAPPGIINSTQAFRVCVENEPNGSDIIRLGVCVEEKGCAKYTYLALSTHVDCNGDGKYYYEGDVEIVNNNDPLLQVNYNLRITAWDEVANKFSIAKGPYRIIPADTKVLSVTSYGDMLYKAPETLTAEERTFTFPVTSYVSADPEIPVGVSLEVKIKRMNSSELAACSNSMIVTGNENYYLGNLLPCEDINQLGDLQLGDVIYYHIKAEYAEPAVYRDPPSPDDLDIPFDKYSFGIMSGAPVIYAACHKSSVADAGVISVIDTGLDAEVGQIGLEAKQFGLAPSEIMINKCGVNIGRYAYVAGTLTLPSMNDRYAAMFKIDLPFRKVVNAKAGHSGVWEVISGIDYEEYPLLGIDMAVFINGFDISTEKPVIAFDPITLDDPSWSFLLEIDPPSYPVSTAIHGDPLKYVYITSAPPAEAFKVSALGVDYPGLPAYFRTSSFPDLSEYNYTPLNPDYLDKLGYLTVPVTQIGDYDSSLLMVNSLDITENLEEIPLQEDHSYLVALDGPEAIIHIKQFPDNDDVLFATRSGIEDGTYPLTDVSHRLNEVEGDGIDANRIVTARSVTDNGELPTDFDNDGDYDLLILNNNTGNAATPRLFINDGQGGFEDITNGGTENVFGDIASLVMGPNTFNGAAGDFDNDADLDVVILSVQSPNKVLTVFKNNLSVSGLSFEDVTLAALDVLYPPTGDFSDVELIDIDNDGDLDILLLSASAGPGHHKVYLNDGIGAFTENTSVSAELTAGVIDAMPYDLNDDGYMDIVLAFTDDNDPMHNYAGCVMINNQSGGFNYPEYFPDDSSISPAYNSQVNVGNIYDELGNISTGIFLSNTEKSLLLKIDFDTNGFSVFTDLTNLLDEIGSISSVSSVLADIDNDNALEIIYGDNTQGIRVQKYNGLIQCYEDVTESIVSSANYDPYITDIALTDINRDNNLDLIISCRKDGAGNPLGNRLLMNGYRSLISRFELSDNKWEETAAMELPLEVTGSYDLEFIRDTTDLYLYISGPGHLWYPGFEPPPSNDTIVKYKFTPPESYAGMSEDRIIKTGTMPMGLDSVKTPFFNCNNGFCP